MVTIHVLAVDRDGTTLFRHNYTVTEAAWLIAKVEQIDLALASAKAASRTIDEFTQYRIARFEFGSIDIAPDAPASTLSQRVQP